MSRSRLIALVLPLALSLGAGSAAASIPGPDGEIHGCYGERGTLRVIDSEAKCPAGETALNWNVKGSPGGIGPRGDKGDAGVPGRVEQKSPAGRPSDCFWVAALELEVCPTPDIPIYTCEPGQPKYPECLPDDVTKSSATNTKRTKTLTVLCPAGKKFATTANVTTQRHPKGGLFDYANVFLPITEKTAVTKNGRQGFTAKVVDVSPFFDDKGKVVMTSHLEWSARLKVTCHS